MQKIWILLWLILASSCSSKQIKNDPYAAPMDTGYHGAEIEIKDRKYYGLAAVKAPANGVFNFSVIGYYTGTIKASSEECDYSESKTYVDFMATKFSMKMHNHKRCLIAISVLPEFSLLIAGENPWSGYTGMILVRQDPHNFVGDTFQSQYNHEISWYFTVKSKEAKVFLKGCGLNFNKRFTIGEHFEKFLVDLNFREKACVIDGFIKGVNGGKQDTTVSILVTQYKMGFVPISTPVITFDGETIKVESDSYIGVINYDNFSYFNNEAHFIVNRYGDSIIRFLTNKGRTAFCFTDPDKKESRCYQ